MLWKRVDPSEKSDLRRQLRARRAELALANPDAAERVVAHLPMGKLPALAGFSGYRAMGSELDPSPLIRHLAETGAIFALPALKDAEAPLEFRAWDPHDRLVADLAGVPSPPPHAPLIHPDLVIAPLLAFDRRGGRLGQGGGHYDRTLEALRAHRPVFVLGLAYAGQEVDQVPCEPHDQRLDAILTENGYMAVETN